MTNWPTVCAMFGAIWTFLQIASFIAQKLGLGENKTATIVLTRMAELEAENARLKGK